MTARQVAAPFAVLVQLATWDTCSARTLLPTARIRICPFSVCDECEPLSLDSLRSGEELFADCGARHGSSCGFVPTLPQFLAEDTCEPIGPGTCCERNNDPDELRLSLSPASPDWGKRRGQDPEHHAARMHPTCGHRSSHRLPITELSNLQRADPPEIKT